MGETAIPLQPNGETWLNVYLDPELKQWVRIEAAKAGSSMSEYIRALLERERTSGSS